MFLSKLLVCVVPLNTACSKLQVIRVLLEMSCKIMTSGPIRTMAEMYPTAVQSVVSFLIYITAESAYSTLQVSYVRLSHVTETTETGCMLLPCNMCCHYFTREHTIPQEGVLQVGNRFLLRGKVVALRCLQLMLLLCLLPSSFPSCSPCCSTCGCSHCCSTCGCL